MSKDLDKIVKLACKPKNARPKDKYLEYVEHRDAMRSLALRLREPNAIALVTLHTMIRKGNADNVLSYLSSNMHVLRLQNVSNQQWEGYTPPSHLGHYATYLESRIAAYRELKHDLVTVQTESNRNAEGRGANSKARRLRHLPVEKGLLREVKVVQKILSALVQCRDSHDELNMWAWRLVSMDLLVLFQAGNEGVCNILEHYFEMSKVDATESFDIYKSFIKQTDRIVDFLNMVKNLNTQVGIPVPSNLKHAPTSLVKALKEYLDDPNFEQNRIEYKRSMAVAEGRAAPPSPGPASGGQAPKAEVKKPDELKPVAPPGASKQIQDFFDSIEIINQPSGPSGSANGFQPQMQNQQAQMFQMQQQPQEQMAMANPFRQSMMMPQSTGFMQPQATGFMGGGGGGFLQPQATGQTAFGNNPMSMFPGAAGQQQQQPFMQPQQTGFMQPQQTGFMQPQQTGFIQSTSQPGMSPFQPGMLQPQTTGNPFRHSMMAPVNTGSIGPSGAFSQPASPFHQQAQAGPMRAGSTPAVPQPLTAQPTGSKNPFAPANPAPAPQVPKGPSMNELAVNRFNAQFAPQGQSSAAASLDPLAQSSNGTTKSATAGGAMSDIASAFADTSASNNPLAQFGALNMGSTVPGAPKFNTIGSTPNSGSGATSPSFLQPQSTGFLQPQRTGYGGSTVRPFKPTSNFGAGLLDTLPPIQEPGATPAAASTPGSAGGMGGMQTQPTGFPFSQGKSTTSPGANNASAFGGLGSLNGFGGASSAFGGQGPGQASSPSPFAPQQTGLAPQKTGFQPTSSFGQQLVAQTTGGGANPFRQSMLSLQAQPTGAGGMGGSSGGGMGGLGAQSTGAGAFGMFGATQGGAFGSSSPFAGQNRQQQNGSSLI